MSLYNNIKDTFNNFMIRLDKFLLDTLEDTESVNEENVIMEENNVNEENNVKEENNVNKENNVNVNEENNVNVNKENNVNEENVESKRETDYLFLHLNEKNCSYFEHFKHASYYSSMSFKASFYFLVHAFYPDFYQDTGSITIDLLNNEIKKRI
jgi:hypothetical protein